MPWMGPLGGPPGRKAGSTEAGRPLVQLHLRGVGRGSLQGCEPRVGFDRLGAFRSEMALVLGV